MKRLTVEERFWAKVNKTDTCWVWTHCTRNGGYGLFWNGEKSLGAHCYSYILHKGPILKGLFDDELKYAIYETADVQKLIKRLQETLTT